MSGPGEGNKEEREGHTRCRIWTLSWMDPGRLVECRYMMAQERETERWALPGTLMRDVAGYQGPGGRCVCGVRQVCLATVQGVWCGNVGDSQAVYGMTPLKMFSF